MIDQAVLQLSPAQKSLDVLGFGAILVKIGEFSGKNLKSSVVCSYIFWLTLGNIFKSAPDLSTRFERPVYPSMQRIHCTIHHVVHKGGMSTNLPLRPTVMLLCTLLVIYFLIFWLVSVAYRKSETLKSNCTHPNWRVRKIKGDFLV